MSRVSESVLFGLAKLLYRTEVAHSTEMKQSLADWDNCHTYRASRIDPILEAAARHGVDIRGKDLLDLGSSDGSLARLYPERGAQRVIGVDVDADLVAQAKKLERPGLSFAVCTTDEIPLPDECVDVIICYDVFEHVTQPAAVLRECRRVLRPGGQMLIGTWGWYHPYAPHLWTTMPVPWAHVFFSERTVMRTCRRVYNSPWYTPMACDVDEKGQKLPDKYTLEYIPEAYLNKLLIRDFERVFRESGLAYAVHPRPFSSKWARWTKVFLRVPWLREFVTAYIWVVLHKRP